jgi:hypothetical protein
MKLRACAPTARPGKASTKRATTADPKAREPAGDPSQESS